MKGKFNVVDMHGKPIDSADLARSRKALSFLGQGPLLSAVLQNDPDSFVEDFTTMMDSLYEGVLREKKKMLLAAASSEAYPQEVNFSQSMGDQLERKIVARQSAFDLAQSMELPVEAMEEVLGEDYIVALMQKRTLDHMTAVLSRDS